MCLCGGCDATPGIERRHVHFQLVECQRRLPHNLPRLPDLGIADRPCVPVEHRRFQNGGRLLLRVSDEPERSPGGKRPRPPHHAS